MGMKMGGMRVCMLTLPFTLESSHVTTAENPQADITVQECQREEVKVDTCE